MKTRWFLALTGLLVVAMVGLIIWGGGLNPKAKKLIGLSSFASPREIAKSVHHALRPSLDGVSSLVFFLNESDPFQLQIVEAIGKDLDLAIKTQALDFYQSHSSVPGSLEIVVTEFPRSRKEEAKFNWCPNTDWSNWQCLALPFSKSLYRKTAKQDYWSGFLIQVAANKYVLGFHFEASAGL